MLILVGTFGVLAEPMLDPLRDSGGAILISGVSEAVRRLNHAGHWVVALADRSGPNGAPFDSAMLDRIHGQLRDQLRQGGARLDDILVEGPPSSADVRSGGAMGEAVRRYRVDPAEAILISDSLPDLRRAAALGCRRILVRTGRGARTQAEGLPRDLLPVQVHDNLPAAVQALLGSDG
jgi:D-glycero-D-manno-heptose 1,7-bisphosphate phosphatase